MNKKLIKKLTKDEQIIFDFKQILKKANKLDKAEDTLKKVLDLINSNENLVHFISTKKEIRKPIEEYFKGRKNNETKR